MGPFIALPDGTFLLLNGALNGTAGYSNITYQTIAEGNLTNPYWYSLASGPIETPAIYDPTAPKGSRWSNAGLGASNIPRLYHSSAILLPDASVLVAGSNPNIDVNLTTVFPTTYQAEIFYPKYFNGAARPQPSGIPSKLGYGGSSFDITIPSTSYSGSSNTAAQNTIISLIRPGWVTHDMSMNMRYLQLNNTYSVNSDGWITFHTSQLPPNSNIFQPGPAFLFVTVNGIPSNGTYVIVGSGEMGAQPTNQVQELPVSVGADGTSGSGNDGSGSSGSGGSSAAVVTGKRTTVLGICVAVVGLLGLLL